MSLKLPVEEVLEQIKQCLREGDELVIEAPPGAGKTTLVPLALMHEKWLADKKILMLEPRRIAARAAAFRMADLINETPGQTIGYRMRLDTRVSARTRIEVITEGILTRMLQQDPSLEGVGLVIFDEFHERNLDSDLALALCLKGRSLFRDNAFPLKILVMSATLDSNAISQMLNDAALVKSAGKAYPVDIIYGQSGKSRERIVERMVATIKQVLKENPRSSLLAFLPGQGEIHRAADVLANWLHDNKINDIHLRPLFGNLTIQMQQAAIAPLSGNQANDQKVVLATNIAETSLTIEGVDVVVDCGLARESRFDPTTGMASLHTVKISRASSIQRTGRAGRIRPGKCYRLWSFDQQQQLAAHGTAEILKADLASLALQLLQWGVDDASELEWLDPPPKGSWQQAVELLKSLAAIERKAGALVLTAHGQAMASLAVHPRLAHLLVCGAEIGSGKPASLLASLLSERDPFAQDDPDISHRLDILTGESHCPPKHQGWLHRSRQLAQQIADQLSKQKLPVRLTRPPDKEQLPGYLLACAYPDRIARRRHSGGYQLANGRSASLKGQNHLGKYQWLSVAEVTGVAGGKGDIIRSAAPLDENLFATVLRDFVGLETIAEWDRKTGRFVAEEQQKIGKLVLHRTPLKSVPVEAKRAVLIQYIQKQGLQILPWKKEDHQWCARVSLARSTENEPGWPDVSPQVLLDSLENWLAPYLDKVNLLQDFARLDLRSILAAMLPYEKHQQLKKLAPERIKVPSGSSIVIDYTESPPVLAVKLQEMFGCEQTPTVLSGKVPLLVHLLSPAGRPLQITQDLAGFWRSSYHDVKKEMKGRYPRHPWPDDPLKAVATRRTKKSEK